MTNISTLLWNERVSEWWDALNDNDKLDIIGDAYAQANAPNERWRRLQRE